MVIMCLWSKSYTLRMTVSSWESQNNALWDTLKHALYCLRFNRHILLDVCLVMLLLTCCGATTSDNKRWPSHPSKSSPPASYYANSEEDDKSH